MSAASTVASHAFWTDESGDRARTVFSAEGIRCAVQPLDRAGARLLAGIERVNVNVATSRVCVDWASRPQSASRRS